MHERLLEWMQWGQQWLWPAVKVLTILVLAWLLQTLVRKLIERVCRQRELPLALVLIVRRAVGTVIAVTALLLILDVFGVSGTVLWTAFTSFAAVGAIAFFAAWSVLSNIFCSILILFTRPFRLHDTVELVENGEKPGFKGRVMDVNLLYTTLMESGDGQNGTLVQIPNSLFFQRTLRRWRGSAVPTLPAQWPERASDSQVSKETPT
jgi:small-conductance mechanosensitive channel